MNGKNKTQSLAPGNRGHMGPNTNFSEKAKNFKGTLSKLINYMSEYKLKVLFVIIFAVASTVFSIVGPKILGNATTKLFEGILSQMSDSGGIDFTAIGNILVFLLILYVASAIFSYIQGYIMTDVTMKITYNLRSQVFNKISKIPLSYFDTTNHGEVLSRITNDIDTLSQTLNQSVTQIITSFVSLVGILIMMFSISWNMTLIAICIILLSGIIIKIIVKRSQKHFLYQQQYLGHVNGHVEEMYGGHIVIKAFNREQESIEAFNEYNDKLYDSAWRSQFLSGLMMPVMNFISNLGYVGVCLYGGYLAVNKGLAVGDIQAFVQYVRQFTQPISQLANISAVLQQTAAAAERVFEFLDEEEETVSDQKTMDLANVNITGDVKFKNVHFGYTSEKIIIKDFNADIKSGQKVAIVGPTGSGKTTMIKLLMRFYDLNTGSIIINGHDIKSFSRNDLRSIFGMVLQDTWLYNDSIMENIRYGNLSATDEEVKSAAKTAQVDHFIKTLPGSYDMVLNEEITNISQGQKQLLTIARSILSNPKILILDEATSSVDTRTEIHIQKAMQNLMQGRTSFVIAHRLSTIKDADLILVMKDGDIVEQGTHDFLISINGFYADMYNSQFEMALES